MLTIADRWNAPLLDQHEIAAGSACSGNLPRRSRRGGNGPVEGSFVGLALRWGGWGGCVGVGLVGGGSEA